MSIEIRYNEDEKEEAVKYVEKIVEKFSGEGKITFAELDKGNKDIIKFKNDQGAQSFIDELRKRFDRNQVSVRFEPFYKSRKS